MKSPGWLSETCPDSNSEAALCRAALLVQVFASLV
eukprot:CAMPEP_0115157018 /NCGR_PEP_ID=MMETSP0227-20121206/68803_1 /TAXON_ID=89957 /ORGANISM="Polarella glacialis, Strain CCMP 1383" /LENGTH=34 /DNA_ID= /DNA_START= /DNA_END= /DNA_ORIENTATION=